MNKKLVGLIGIVSAAVSFDAAQASTPPQPSVVDTALAANSFADLLAPIPDAVALLKSSDAALAQNEGIADVEVAQLYFYPHRHHHHHRFYHHHHHHHRYFRHHHHHHHHHHHRFFRY